MSFTGYKDLVEGGDTVIVYLNVNNMYVLTMKAGGVFQTKYGALKHDDVIGTQFGKKVKSSGGWVYILHPTPELWTITLPHRTQILYTPDISVITLQLQLKPGSVVCEAGTGSGSLSHAMLRSIAPTGHLYTFDFHEKRVTKAAEEFREHGLEQLVTAQLRDVVNDGFGLEDAVDALFLDLPMPWQVVPSAVKTFKCSGGRLCSFSPCIEQVQRTCLALETHRFTDIVTIECVPRMFDVRPVSMPSISSSSTSGAANTHGATAETPTTPETKTFYAAIPPTRMTGHTGYLTFATLGSRKK